MGVLNLVDGCPELDIDGCPELASLNLLNLPSAGIGQLGLLHPWILSLKLQKDLISAYLLKLGAD